MGTTKPRGWPATLDGWLDRVVPGSARDQLTPESRRTILRCIFDSLSVIEQLVWVVNYGEEPPVQEVIPGQTFTVAPETVVHVGLPQGAIESASIYWKWDP